MVFEGHAQGNLNPASILSRFINDDDQYKEVAALFNASLKESLSNEEQELLRTLTTLFSTRAGSQPADRDFGISWECLDELPEVAESLFALEAYRKVEKYEPRVEMKDIEFENAQGLLIPHIYFTGREGR